MLNIPCLPVVFTYPKSKITIGGWSVTRRKAGLTFSFFVKPSTRTYEWLKVGDDFEVYSEEDFFTYARRVDKTELNPKHRIMGGTVCRIIQVDDYKLVECRIELLFDHKNFYFNQGKHIEKINSHGWGSR